MGSTLANRVCRQLACEHAGGVTMATFTNGGFGFFPVLIAKILFLYNIPIEIGNAFGWIVWTSQLVITVILGGLALILLPTFAKKK